ncbi:hypothetical protein IAQ61_009983, partial [Plenodomus lingam]|uniref:uncharacterized protein n=1 Tax=Leptosphaeria maculans TaxID=5022 RepID=UPI003319346A
MSLGTVLPCIPTNLLYSETLGGPTTWLPCSISDTKFSLLNQCTVDLLAFGPPLVRLRGPEPLTMAYHLKLPHRLIVLMSLDSRMDQPSAGKIHHECLGTSHCRKYAAATYILERKFFKCRNSTRSMSDRHHSPYVLPMHNSVRAGAAEVDLQPSEPSAIMHVPGLPNWGSNLRFRKTTLNIAQASAEAGRDYRHDCRQKRVFRGLIEQSIDGLKRASEKKQK